MSCLSDRKKRIIYIFFAVYAGLVMFLCAGSSPIIQYLSPDSSIFFVMGRSAANGLVLYRDVADHKGFYLFLFNWIGAAITPNSMNGLFFVEIVFAYIKLIYVYKIAYMFLESHKKSILASLGFLAMATNFLSWNTGNLGETFAMAFQVISFFYIARYYTEKRTTHPPIWMFIHGICSGIVLLIQANMVGMWIAFGLYTVLFLGWAKRWKNLCENILAGLAGVFCTLIPVIMYGLVHGCLRDMYYIMFEVNMLYSRDGRIGKTIVGYLKEFISSPSFVIVVIACMSIVVVWKNRNKKAGFVFATMVLFSVVCMSISLHVNSIYYTNYIVFSIPFWIYVAKHVKGKHFGIYVFCCGILLCGTVICNLQLIKKVCHIGSSSYVYESAYQMGNLIEDKDSKVLVLGESSFYNCTQTIPHIRYFTIFVSGLRYETFPYCVDEQYGSLMSGENDYIIIHYIDGQDNFWKWEEKNVAMKDYLDKNYECILDYTEGGIHCALWKKNR